MLSRVAQASRLGLTAGRLSRTAAVQPLRIRPAAAAPASQFLRTFANKKPSSAETPKAAPKQASPAPKDPAEAGSSAQEDNVGSSAEQKPAEPEPEPIPFHKLPDLTQGIPSTLEAELEQRAGKSQSSLEVSEEEAAGGGGRGRGGKEEYVSTSERNRKWWTRFMLIVAGTGSVLGVGYMGRNWEDPIEAERHPDIPNGWSPALWWQRTRARWGESVSYYQDPAFEKLLPDPDPSFERPYTLCISLDDMLIHSEWTREHGWRVAKRPGMDYFIRYLSQYYELVLFTTASFGMAEPLVRKLDPFRLIMWPLYREATKYEDGEIVKDLSYLNRDLSKVIILDTKASHVRKQPENAIIMEPWKGDASDKDLVALIPFLEYIHTMQYSDVRKVLKSFEGKHIPTEFARREAIARREFNKQLAEKAKHGKPSGMGALGNLLGLKPSKMSMTVPLDGEQDPSEAYAQGKMLQDIARERGQRNYQALEKEIRENGEKWLKEEQQAMEKAQQEMMNSMMGSFSGMFAAKKDGASNTKA
ncbi:mitochondrial import inner membrane translocase subunit tim-50 [Trichoderma arundinaceum]|uniref:Mitochondrial import inner membrane translocase subunit TIM50 n=1 Tax=Trichoderma arundinaceum TaxID=490622 RepID=A0A395NJ91_TRIAR|nr:mitochondrial import inner membrane translocase subunit tim-50 [Trichoderma arundinaceum]